MNIILYLVRHSLCEPCASKQEADWPLTKEGKTQAINLVHNLNKLCIGKIFSSPYKRALDSIEPFAKDNNLKIEVVDGLKEKLLFDGYLDDYLPSVIKSWDDFHFKYAGAESSKEAQERIIKTITDIASRHTEGNFILVSHGNIIALLLNYLDKSFGLNQWEKMNNPDLFKVIWDGESFCWKKDFHFDLVL